ncbi:MAG TPA: response regulator transcription factor [Candidatus Paceibacterota bacterium]
MDAAVTGTLIRNYLLFFILPLWIMAGLVDYWLHRWTRIEATSGTKESLLHALQLGEAGIATVAGLFFDINSLILLIMTVAFIAHEASALWDSSYAIGRRYVGALEQHVHSFLELLPLMAVSFVTLLSWQQFLALFGMGGEPPRFEIRLKQNPLSSTYLFSLISAIAVFVIVPYAEEFWRCIRTKALRDKEHSEEKLRAVSGELQKRVNEQPAGTAPPQYGDGHRQRKAVITVLLVDDHAMVRQGLRSVMETFPNIEIVGEASNGNEAVKLVERRRPAVVLMDINMPKLNGIEATARIKTEYPHVAIIGLSVNAESANQEAMKKAGATMLLPKEAVVDELYNAILSVSS